MTDPTPTIPKPVQAARLFAALADPTRLSLLISLRSGVARSIARLSTHAGMTRQGVTKHLCVLEDAGFVTAVRVGREIHYHYRPEALATVQTYLDAIAGRWDSLAARPAAEDVVPTSSQG